MDWPITRRGLFRGAAVAGTALAFRESASAGVLARRRRAPGWVTGKLTGAQAVVETLLAECTDVVFGIPGAQENELWDEFKSRGLAYLLAAHEYGAACMADGYARATGRPGVLCVVPGPGITNALTGLGEALLDSSPVVAIVGDVGNGAKYRPFQVHSLDSVGLLKPVTKCVYPVCEVGQIPDAIRQAFAAAVSGEPGPSAVVIPYNLLIDVAQFNSGPIAEPGIPFDEAAFERAVAVLCDKKRRVGIYAGFGCMDNGDALSAVADLLQAPVATSVSGKGAIPECHPLAVGWGYGKHASYVAEKAFARDPLHPFHSGVDCVLAVGVKYSEVSTGYYGNPKIHPLIHVDANTHNLGMAVSADVCVQADAGAFLAKLLERCDAIRRPADPKLIARIRKLKADHARQLADVSVRGCGIDPLAVVAALRRNLPCDAVLFTDVSVTEHLAAEFYRVDAARSYFNPVDNQSMGWSLPAAIGAQRADCRRTVATLTGDGCLLMAIQELSTAARAGLAVKVVVLDDRAYHYMQMLQKPAYRRTTATHLAKLDYAGLAQGFGVGYVDVDRLDRLDAGLQTALATPGPVVVRVVTDYGKRKVRWVEAVRDRFVDELSAPQKARFLARIAAREVDLKSEVND